MSNRVAILGGGIGGLSAAHELIERGFAVSVYEKNNAFGGKARSTTLPGTGTDGRKDLPGEHGFRFFPAFYKHVPDTMQRIPFPGNVSVFNNLVHATRIDVLRAGKAGVVLAGRIPQDAGDWVVELRTLFSGIGVSDQEVLFFVDRLLALLTSCPERRLAEYEQVAWWDFIQASKHSAEYQILLGQGLSRSLVAMRAKEGSTRTVGYILLQLVYGILSWGGFDRLLAGPTNEVWLDPWLAYLRQKGVVFESGCTVQEFQLGTAGISGVAGSRGGLSEVITADYYISALPVERMAPLVSASLKAAAPSLANLGQLQTRWMNGIQFYLKQDITEEYGHTIYADSPWALTSISQRQFWKQTPIRNYGDGNLGGILSLDISEWDEPGILYGKPANRCTAEEIKNEVWAQVKVHLNVGDEEVIHDDNLLSWYLDPDIQFPNPSGVTNLEPLLINTVNSLKNRPEAVTEVPNLFLASDYVRTYTDLATMEGANEAARRAVNGILDRSGSTTARATIWPLQEPDFFAPMVEYDRLRFRLGLPHGKLGL